MTIKRTTWLANLLLVLWLLLASSAVLPLLLDADGSDEGKASVRLFLIPVIMAAAILMLIRGRPVFNLLLSQPFLIMLVAWIWLSTMWSVDPALTARRALSFTANTLIACQVVTYFTPRQIFRQLLNVMIALVLISVAFALVAPDAAFMADIGGMRGVFTHKNGMGAILVWTAVALAVNGRIAQISPATMTAGFALVLAVAIPTGSATSLMLIFLIGVLQITTLVAKLPGRIGGAIQFVVLLGGCSIVLPLLVGRNQLFMAIGRDPTLTGRTELWAFVQGMINQRPIQGYGYQAFFDLPGVATEVLATVGWPAPNAHNGYLEVWLGLGIIGLLFCLCFLGVGLLRALRCVLADPQSPPAIFALLTLSVYMVRNFSESDLIDQSSLSWIMAVMAVLLVRLSPLSASNPIRPWPITLVNTRNETGRSNSRMEGGQGAS